MRDTQEGWSSSIRQATTGNCYRLYSFIVIDNLGLDLFVHYDDLSKAGLSKEKLVALKNNCELRFQFTYYEY